MKLRIFRSCHGLMICCWLAGCASPTLYERFDGPYDDGSHATQSSPSSALPETALPPFAGSTLPNDHDTVESENVKQITSQNVSSAQSPDDLWQRIRRSFQIPDLDTMQVREFERWYVARPDYMQRMAERSRKYLFHIVTELEQRRMPSELALLPFVESAFNPHAVSAAKAAGIWQFIPSTGKQFDLKQNAFCDDRRDVLASARAALEYLQNLYGKFGDWPLALAAYNWGEGNVARAIAKNKRADLGTGYLDLGMPEETRLYLPKLQAVKNIVANPQVMGTSLPLIENHPHFRSVGITRDIDVALAARLAEVGVNDFKTLNPSMNRLVIFAAGTPQILLPWDNASKFQANFRRYHGPTASWTVWIAPRTMKPAEAAKRTGMTEAELRSVNQIPGGVSIKAGSTLVVPRGGTVLTNVSALIANSGQLASVKVPERFLKTKKAGGVASISTRPTTSELNSPLARRTKT